MATDYFGAKYFSGGYFPESYFGTGEAADPNAMQGTASGSSSCTATLSVAQVAPSRSSGVTRLAKQKFVPQPRVVGLFFRPPPTPQHIKPDGGGKPVEPPPAPQVETLLDEEIERHADMLERRVSAVERRMAERIAEAERRIATVTLLDKKRQELSAVRGELAARQLKKQIAADDELILMLLAA